jgi:hypothetical protein
MSPRQKRAEAASADLWRARRLSSGDPVWVFLVRAVWAAKTPILRVGIPWISLDSLVRIETFQWVTRIKSGRFFPLGFVLEKQPSKWLAHDSACGRDELLMRQA